MNNKLVVVEYITRKYPTILAEKDIKKPNRGEMVSNAHPAARDPIV